MRIYPYMPIIITTRCQAAGGAPGGGMSGGKPGGMQGRMPGGVPGDTTGGMPGGTLSAAIRVLKLKLKG